MSIVDDFNSEQLKLLTSILRRKSNEANFLCRKYKDKVSCARAEEILKLYKHIELLTSKYKR